MSYILGGLLEGLGQAAQGYAGNIQETQQKKDLMKEQFGYDKELAKMKGPSTLEQILAMLGMSVGGGSANVGSANVGTNNVTPQGGDLEEVVGPNGEIYGMAADGTIYDAAGNKVQ